MAGDTPFWAMSMIDGVDFWRPAIFISVLCLLLLAQRLIPRRNERAIAGRRFANYGLGAVNIIVLRVLVPGGLVAIAMLNMGGGLTGWLPFGFFTEVLICLLALDLTLYLQHRAFHKIPLLWRFHAPHHADRELDVSSGLRFHPGEAVISFAIKAAAIVALGVHPAIVIMFEILLNAASLFNHADIRLGRADGWLQKLIVTPDMHRLHHSRRADEALSNFGFFLSIWDRLFASYALTDNARQQTMPLGLDEQPDSDLLASLKAPFLR
jgi:sterol desaturase/sphingolipid hydroxylase (fatty acid hydroxylase superfamily)